MPDRYDEIATDVLKKYRIEQQVGEVIHGNWFQAQSEVAAAISAAVAEERERCAMIAREHAEHAYRERMDADEQDPVWHLREMERACRDVQRAIEGSAVPQPDPTQSAPEAGRSTRDKLGRARGELVYLLGEYGERMDRDDLAQLRRTIAETAEPWPVEETDARDERATDTPLAGPSPSGVGSGADGGGQEPSTGGVGRDRGPDTGGDPAAGLPKSITVTCRGCGATCVTSDSFGGVCHTCGQALSKLRAADAPPATTNLAAVVGKWPGDETEAELAGALGLEYVRDTKPDRLFDHSELLALMSKLADDVRDAFKKGEKPNTSDERVGSDNTSAGPLTLEQRALYAVQNCRILETTEDEDAQAIAKLCVDFARDALREIYEVDDNDQHSSDGERARGSFRVKAEYAPDPCRERRHYRQEFETMINAAIEAAAKGVRR
jgi:hypothetical protein